MPLAGFTWRFAEARSLQALLPRDLSLVCQHDDWVFSLGFRVDSDEYHVRSLAAPWQAKVDAAR